jgi:hypothetical protein
VENVQTNAYHVSVEEGLQQLGEKHGKLAIITKLKNGQVFGLNYFML